MGRRDDFAIKTKRKLKDRVGSYCSNPDCSIPTVGPSKQSNSSVSSIGVAAHITAASIGGPRYNETLTTTKRRSIENGLWLCSTCSTLIDNNNGCDYSVSKLNNWKKNAEVKARHRLEKKIPPDMQKWEGRLSSISYVNVPRLIQRLPTNTPDLEILEELHCGFPEGSIIQYLHVLDQAVKSFEIDAAPLEMFNEVTDQSIGAIISFDFNGRTKNGPKFSDASARQENIQNFNEKESPHFYYKNKNWKWIFPYDPRWITTTTARCEFNAGRAWFAGLGIIKNYCHDKKEAIVSPLVVGLPRRDFHDQMDCNLFE